ncbi:MAG: chemotaxis protein CheA [Pararhodobacter sp.]|nr:chemotaxis protein CheA [Pararhodobacter sp.]
MSGNDLREAFFQECEDLLEALQEGLQQIDSPEHDPETVHAVFRAVHSIKGGAGAFGLDALVQFAHRFETVLDRLREGEISADGPTIKLFYRAGDHLSDLVAMARSGDDAAEPDGAELLGALDELAGDAEDEDLSDLSFQPMTLDLDMIGAPDPDAACEKAGQSASGAARWLIDFTPTAALYASGNDPALLFRSLAQLGALTVHADTSGVAPLETAEPGPPGLRWQLELETDAALPDILAVFEFVEGMCGLEITPAADSLYGEDGPKPALPDNAAPGEATAIDAASASDPTAAANDETSPPADAGAGGPDGHDSAPPPATPANVPGSPPMNGPTNGGKATGAPQPTIRVNLDRVDRLINLVGELVIKEAMLAQSIAQLELPNDSSLHAGLDGLKQLAGDIQEGVMAIRAQPVKPMFQRMFRIVREAAAATGKQVRLDVQGEHTEVDKTVIERLVDPLTHMIRNAVDHGLETPEERLGAGKPAEGRVMLSAAHRSGRVMIEISDDGGGVDRERVRAIAERKGLVTPGADLTATEIDNLLFLPGFSSKDQVSNLSGRGVGLDVARSEIEALGGRVLITSRAGAGTTFSISLPLTLAVLEGMVVEVAGQTLVLPISVIQETLQPSSVAIHPLGRDSHVLANRGDLVPLVDLGARLGYRSEPPVLDDRVLLIVQLDNGRRGALVVDRIHDQRQVVIKSLERNYGQVKGVAAATILGDGRIALIIDPDEVIGAGAEPPPGDMPAAATG